MPAELGEHAGMIGAAALARELEPCRRATEPMKLGITLPSFQEDPERALGVARAAEEAGVDGVFALRPSLPRCPRRHPAARARGHDHCSARSRPRPAPIAFGPLVARATLRPPATLGAALDTLARIAPGRLVAALGAGDSQSEAENVAFGVDLPSEQARGSRRSTRRWRRRGAAGYPVWVGGTAFSVRVLAADRPTAGTDGVATRPGSRARREAVRRRARGRPLAVHVVVGWPRRARRRRRGRDRRRRERLGATPGALVGGPERMAGEMRAFGDAGAEWVIVGPLDSSDPDNARLLGERVKPLLG